MRGPLENLKCGWIEGNVQEQSVVAQLREKMATISKIVGRRELEAKAKMKKT